MARADTYLDTMLRHLGAAYYQEVHGQAPHAEVTRALDTVEEHLAQQGEDVASGKTGQRAPTRRKPLRAPRHLDPH